MSLDNISDFDFDIYDNYSQYEDEPIYSQSSKSVTSPEPEILSSQQEPFNFNSFCFTDIESAKKFAHQRKFDGIIVADSKLLSYLRVDHRRPSQLINIKFIPL